MSIIKADAIAKQQAKTCQYCHRYTEQLCANCSWRVCPQHPWTEVTKRASVNGVVGFFDKYSGTTNITERISTYQTRELCRACRDAALVAKP